MEELEKTSEELEQDLDENPPAAGSAASTSTASSSAPNPKSTRERTTSISVSQPVAVPSASSAPKGKEKEKEKAGEDLNNGDDESLSDVDDEEIDQLILTTEESEMKSKLWHEMNKEYLEEQEGTTTIFAFMFLSFF